MFAASKQVRPVINMYRVAQKVVAEWNPKFTPNREKCYEQ